MNKEEALRYARLGWYVHPLYHITDSGECSCGRSTCTSPGKHPILTDWEGKASKLPPLVGSYWDKYPKANIGVAAGKSGLLVVDNDSYKEGEKLEIAEEEANTVTSLTPSGGIHLIYASLSGFGNGRGSLPSTVDIRGVGGYIVVPPSNAKDKRYRWKDGRSPFDMDPIPLPSSIEEELTETVKEKRIEFDDEAEVPDLEKLNISRTTKDTITHGHRGGTDRSTTDMSIVNSLVSAGATDEQIKAIYDFYPVGVHGKYGEKGKHGAEYLANTIAKAKDFLERKSEGPGRQDYFDHLRQLGYELKQLEMDDSIWVNGERLTDGQAAEIKNRMRERGFKNSTVVQQHWIDMAYQNSFHPVRSYLRGLEWDGKDHIGQLLRYIDTKETYAPDYDWRFLTRWLIGAVAKAFEKTQNFCLVLAGPQGCGKSYLARELCPLPEYFSESSFDPGGNDSSLRKMRTWIWELGELQAVTRKSDREALKHEISETEVVARAPYDRYDMVKPALTSFLGTINKTGSGFLDDPTGSRRFVILEIDGIDHSYSDEIDFDQVWSQAAHLYFEGESHRLNPEEVERQQFINEGHETVSMVRAVFNDCFEIDREADEWMSSGEILATLEENGLKGNQRMNLIELSEYLHDKLQLEKAQKRLPEGRKMAYRGVISKSESVFR